jgi:hypothetical protein
VVESTGLIAVGAAGGVAPPAFHTLDRSEQLTLWCVRAIALGHGDCPALRRTLEGALGSAADEAFAALFAAVRTLGWCARRRFRLHVPGCDGVSEDEVALLALFAEAQRSLSLDDERAARSRLSAWVEPRLVNGLLATLVTVGGILEIAGHLLPYRPDQGPVRPPGQTVH